MDGTEIPLKKPKVPGAQQVTLSTYKSHNMAKTFIRLTHSGLFSVVSAASGGSTSDRQLANVMLSTSST